MDLPDNYQLVISHFQPQMEIWNLKNPSFLLFFSKFLDFFFQNEIFVQIGLKNTENGFPGILWYLKLFFMRFWMIFETIKLKIFHDFFNVILSFKSRITEHAKDMIPKN